MTASLRGSTFVPSSRTISPLTLTLPSRMRPSLARREATPASARNFWRRTKWPLMSAGNRRFHRLRVRGFTPAATLYLGLGLAKAADAVAHFPLAALLQKGDT